MTTLELLQAVDALLSDESKWCQEAEAKDEYGAAVKANHSRAAQWCLEGAFMRLSGRPTPDDYSRFSAAVLKASRSRAKSMWVANDRKTTDFPKVKRWLARAIATQDTPQ